MLRGCTGFVSLLGPEVRGNCYQDSKGRAGCVEELDVEEVVLVATAKSLHEGYGSVSFVYSSFDTLDERFVMADHDTGRKSEEKYSHDPNKAN